MQSLHQTKGTARIVVARFCNAVGHGMPAGRTSFALAERHASLFTPWTGCAESPLQGEFYS